MTRIDRGSADERVDERATSHGEFAGHGEIGSMSRLSVEMTRRFARALKKHAETERIVIRGSLRDVDEDLNLKPEWLSMEDRLKMLGAAIDVKSNETERSVPSDSCVKGND